MTDNLYRKLSEERKKLQEQDLVPKWYTTGGYQLFKSKYEYQTNGRSVRGQFERIASTAAKHLKGTVYEKDAYQAFFNLFWKGWLSPSTPVLANMGTDRGLPVSCSGTIIEDSVDGFYSNLHEIAMLTKYGFGTASDLSNIRPRGSDISIGGKASGVVPVIKEHVQTMRNIAQGTARRGAWAGYIDIEHGDFFEVCDLLIAEPDDLNIGWTIRQSFIDSLNAGNQDAVNRFKRALKVKVVTGKGYFFFPDKANAQRPQMYVDKGLFINNSQLCVAPETLILTDNGYLKISDLEGKSVNVWNGREFSEVVVKKTGENQKLVKVVTNSGFELQCTPYHKFYIMVRSNTGHRKIVEKRACELNNGDKLIKSNFPIIEGTETLNNAYDNGFFSADGCYTDQGNRVYLYHEKRDLKKYLSGIYTKWYVQEELNREYSHSESLLDKFFVPSGNFTIKSKLEWFAGLCDGDGTVARNGKVQSLQIGSVNKDFLQEVQMMLQTLGVSSKVTIVHEGGFRELPKNDGSKESKNFLCKPFYRLLIGQTGICTMQDLGFKTYRLKFTDYKPSKESTQYVKVVDVVDEGRFDDTYCFTESKRGMGVFNGILTGQCSEIMLFNDKSHTYTCQPGFAPIIKKDIGLTTLENIEVGDEIWSKQGWTKVVDKKSSGVKPVNKYKTNIGSFIGTKDHRIVQNNEKVEVQNAKSIDGVKYEYQYNVTILPEYVMQGLLIGDGTIRNNKVCLCVGEKDQDYYNSEVSNMIDVDGYSYFRNVKTDITFLKNTFDRDIDISQLDSSSKTASLLRGLYSANGSAIKQQDGRVHVILTASSEKVAYKTQLLLQSLGLSPKMYKTNGKQNSFNNGVYNCKDVYRVVIIRQSDVEYFNQNIGFIQQYKTNILKNMKTSLPKKRKLSGEIYDVEYLGDYEVFHIEVENSTHTYWTGGLDVSNCVLSSMNVSLWDEWKDTDAVYWATIFLDCVVSEFLERARGLPGLEKAVRFTEKGRALGLGQAGLHTLFMKNMIPFESFEAHMLSNKIAKHIQSQAIEATKNMAINLGEPEWCKGYGVRNTHLIAIAPTKSTALIMGGISEGVNPDPAMSFTQMTAAGEVDRLNPVLLELMKQKGVFTPKNVKQITEAQGSVQGVDWLTEDEKKVFKTAFEINQQAITRLAGTRQHFVDQGQSINYFFSADENEEYIASIFQEVFEHPHMLSAYYAYMMAGVTASKDTCEACM